MNTIDSSIYEEAKNASSLADGGCGTCQRQGLPFFLVRQSVVKRNMGSIQWSEGIPELQGRKPDPELTEHEYAIRMLREGYVYVLFDHDGKRKLMGYEVTSHGALRHRSIKHMKVFEIEKLAESCSHHNHYIPAIFASIDVLNDTVWVAYSRRAWSKKTEDYYCSAEANLERFTKVIINDKSRLNPSKLTDGRSFDFNDLLDPNKKPFLPEFIYEKESFIPQFPTAHEFYSYADSEKIKDINQVVNKLQKNYQCKIGCIVLEDTFGIAEELNAQRLINSDPVINTIVQQEEQIENELADAYNEKIADFTLVDKWINTPERPTHQSSYIEQYLNKSLGINPSYCAATKNVILKNQLDKYQGLHNSIYVHPYFDRDRVYQRKIVSCIESYQKGLKNYCREKNKAKSSETEYIDKYKPATNYQGALLNYNNSINRLKHNGWQEIILSEQEKKILLENYRSKIPANDVRRFSLTSEDVNKVDFNHEWKKLEERLKIQNLNNFIEKDNELFNDLIKDIRRYSKDYFLYVTWLFGSKDKPSTYAPEGIKKYNQVEFWKYEQENDYSKDHLGFIQDIVTILQGNIQLAKLPEQFGLWDSLFRDEHSIYFYVLKGQEKSIYNWLQKERIEYMQKTVDKVKSWQDYLSYFNSVMDLPLSEKGTTAFVSAIEELINWGTAGITNKPDSAKLINEVLMKDHFVENLKIFSGVEFRRISLPVKLKNAPKVYEMLMKSSDVTSVSIKGNQHNYKLSAIASAEQWKFESELTKKQLNKTVQMEFMIVADDIVSMDNVINTLKKSGRLKESTLVKTNNISGAEVKIAHQFSGELILDDLEKAIATVKKRVRIESTKAVTINLLMLGIQGYFVYQNVLLLNKEGKLLRQEVKEQIIADIQKTTVVISVMSADLVGHLIKIVGALPKTNMFTSMVPGCATFLKGTGAALSAIAIFDGVMDICKGMSYMANGDVKNGVVVSFGGGLSLLSGSIGLWGAIFSTITLPFALLAIGLAIIGAILVYYGSESERWDEMQVWFNRCYFGKHEHPEKGEHYPLTAIGASQALNDYFAYLAGVYLALNYDNDEHELFDRYVIEHNKNSISRDFYHALNVHIKLPAITDSSRYTCVIYLTDFYGKPAKVKIQQGSIKTKLCFMVEQNSCDRESVMPVKSDEYSIVPVGDKTNMNTMQTIVISQKIAELIFKAKQAIAILHYWQDDKAKTPLRLEHQIKG